MSKQYLYSVRCGVFVAALCCLHLSACIGESTLTHSGGEEDEDGILGPSGILGGTTSSNATADAGTADAASGSDGDSITSDTNNGICANVTCGPEQVCDAGVCVCTDDRVAQGDACVTPDPCGDIECGAQEVCNAGACVCVEGYELIDGRCIPEDPCNQLNCAAGEVCVAGSCDCELGYERINGECRQFELSSRTEAQVCARWERDYPTRARQVWQEGEGECNPGTIDPEAHEDGMRRLNLYRWLVGLEPATVDWDNQAMAQQAALMMHANNALSHSPPTSWRCYTDAGATAAQRSNLALGYGTPADSIDGYMRDGNTPSLGHRRWCIFPQLGNTGFGHAGRGGAMWSLGRVNSPAPAFVAYPAPGAFPIDAIQGVWSFSVAQGLAADAQVVVTAISTGEDVPVTVSRTQEGFGLSTLSIAVGQVRAGETYRVEVTDRDRSWEYRTSLVNCD